MALHLRSIRTNYQPAVNSIIFWDNRLPKRCIQLLNQFGLSASYPYQSKAIANLSKDVLNIAEAVANNRDNILELPYNNFNWVQKAWETSLENKSRTHDQVSALLLVLPTPEGKTATEVVDKSKFESLQGSRHRLKSYEALDDILPSPNDHHVFRQHVIRHVMEILLSEIPALSSYSSSLPPFEEPTPLPTKKTEEYFLPTLDQEQGSTRGNMKVLEEYFLNVLKMPKRFFEDRVVTILGDRLTTVQDRAAQAQRALDHSPHSFDHFTSFKMVSGLFHFEMNFISALSSNYWGDKSSDSICFAALLEVLPNRSEINPKKINYYGWLRFLDVVLSSLVIKAVMTALKVGTMEEISTHLVNPTLIHQTATTVADTFILQSTSRLEETNVKTLKGQTVSGHAVTLAHDLMTLREMHDAIKRGHPSRILRMLKFWGPMFYAAGCYNYANETMELLHNKIHEWPKDYGNVAFNGMLVNPKGRDEDWKPTDLRVEHHNDDIKERTEGPNITPAILAKITPAMGHASALTDRIIEELGIEKKNQRHAHVQQHRDVKLAVHHLNSSRIFDFEHDHPSSLAVVDLYQLGERRLAGKDGGHQKHLARHSLTLRNCHEQGQSISGDKELETSKDAQPVPHLLGSIYGDYDIQDNVLISEDENDSDAE